MIPFELPGLLTFVQFGWLAIAWVTIAATLVAAIREGF